MQSTAIIAALALGVPALASAATLTNSNIDSRTTTNVLSFSDLAFDHLDKQRTDVLTFHGSVGDAGNFTIDGPFASTVAVSVTPGSGMSISNQGYVPATQSISYRAAITKTTGLTVTQSWNVTKSSSMTTGIASNGLHYLEYSGTQFGFLKAGGVFDYSVTLPGNWSTTGTATGDSELLSLDPDFKVTQDFVFDPVSDSTTLEVLDTSYGQSQPGVGLDFVLFGSPTPVSEPLPSALLLAGLGATGWLARRRRA